jgi:hypothetical protein
MLQEHEGLQSTGLSRLPAKLADDTLKDDPVHYYSGTPFPLPGISNCSSEKPIPSQPGREVVLDY